jgi:hypothetical protein
MILDENRKIARDCVYKSDWDFDSVIGQCQEKKIAPDRVVRALKSLAYYKIPSERLGGALVLVLKLRG